MAAFEYSALNAKGRQEKGLIEGDTARQVREMLRTRGLMPTEIKQVAEIRKEDRKLFSRKGASLSASELSLFTRQLATLTRSGLPLDEALTAVGEQSEGKSIKRVTLGVRASVVEGSSLARALAEFPGAFPPLFRATVEAGEQSGKLDNVLERLSDYVEGRQELQQKLVVAAIYPAVLVSASLLIVSALLAYVVPQVVSVFESNGGQLPFLTRMLIAISDFIRDYWPLLIALAIGIPWGIRAALKREPIRRRWDRQLLRLPLIGRVVRTNQTARFTRTLGILTNSGVPILDGLQIGAQVVTHLPMRDAIDTAARRVREGSSLSKSLSESRLFPPISLHLIASGEQSGKLDDMLERAAENQERELNALINGLMGALPPLLVLLLGAMVLMIVLGILQPIFESYDLLGA